jgi:S-DNA-T family DNA segregation ATPase FtsK/SpoIIIE
MFLLLAGVLLVTGASRAHSSAARTAVRSAARRPRRAGARPQFEPTAVAPPAALVSPPVDGVEEFPDVVAPAPLLVLDRNDPEPEPEPADATQTSLFDATEPDDGVYTLPDRSLLRRSKATAAKSGEQDGRVAGLLVQALANFGVDATIVGEIAGPRVTRYELQLAPGTKVSKVAALKDDLSYALATTEIRILAPIPGKQAVGVEVPNLAPNLVTLGDIYDDLPATSSPLSVWLGKDISGNA